MFPSMPALVADAVALSAPSSPGAGSTPAAAEPRAEARPTWYGWQTVLTDLGAMTLVSLATRTTDPAPLLVAGALVYVAGGPVVHVEHERSVTALIDVSLRLALPVLLGGLGAAAGSKEAPADCDGFCLSQSTSNAIVGVLVGIGGAMVIDATILGWEPAKTAPAQAARATGLRWGPTASAMRGGAMAGVGGTF